MVYDAWEVNQIPITRVAADWGLQLKRKSKHSWYILCPNPAHKDERFGNCILTENETKNVFHCFVCGAGGGPINLVMRLENCDFLTARNLLIERYQIKGEENAQPRQKWTGLTAEEYGLFDLKNVSVPVFAGYDEWGREVEREERISLRDLAESSPDFHDFLLLRRFLERVYGVAAFLDKMEKGFWHFEIDESFAYSPAWEDSARNILQELLCLLEKGLINKQLAKRLDLEKLLTTASRQLNFTKEDFARVG